MLEKEQICPEWKGDVRDVDSILEVLNLRSKMEHAEVIQIVEEILMQVKNTGDQGILYFTEKFDGVCLTGAQLKVSSQEMEAAYASLDPELIRVMKQSAAQIQNFHQQQVETGFSLSVGVDSQVGMMVRPLASVGIYVPAGTAALPSTVLMNVIPARVAGVKKIVMTTPPGKDGKIAPAILVAAKIAGAHEIYKVGGAQAIAALAYGTSTIPQVHKITGPGNIYVNTAKRLVFGQVDIDMFAGPSEILIVADETAQANFVAADMLSQAEHDKLASALLVTTSTALATQVQKELAKQIVTLPRQDIATASLKAYGGIILVDNLNTAIAFANKIAPEHLELCIEHPEKILPLIENAGAVFLGNFSPEPLGDYWAGPNHTLPTSGTSRFFSPLHTGDFLKKMSLIHYSQGDLKACYQDVAYFARAEGLEGHSRSMEIRFEQR